MKPAAPSRSRVRSADSIRRRGIVPELFFAGLSVVSIVNSLILYLHPPARAAWQVAAATEVVLTAFYAADFVLRSIRQKASIRYISLGAGWADAVSILPGFRILRAIPLIRTLRGLRIIPRREIIDALSRKRAAAALYATILAAVIIIEGASIGVLYFEATSDLANIHTAADALWWGLVTITTVGYGDRYPVTTGGRIFGVFLLTMGIAVFAVFTGYLTIYFRERKPSAGDRTGSLGEKFDELKDMHEEMGRRIEEIRDIAGREE